MKSGQNITFNGEKIISPIEEDLNGGMLSVGNGSVEIYDKEVDSRTKIEVSGQNIQINGENPKRGHSEGRTMSIGRGSVEVNFKENKVKLIVSGHNIQINGKKLIYHPHGRGLERRQNNSGKR